MTIKWLEIDQTGRLATGFARIQDPQGNGLKSGDTATSLPIQTTDFSRKTRNR